MAKEKKATQPRKDDAVINKIFVWFISAVVLECILFLVNRFYVDVHPTDGGVAIMVAISYIVKVVPFVGVIAAALFAIRGMTFAKKGQDAGKYAVGCILSLVVALCSFIIWRFYDAGVKFLYVLVPVIAVLALIYYLYQREFFLSALVCGLGVTGLWAVRRGGMENHKVLLCLLLAVTIVVAAVSLALAAKARSNKGVVKLGGRNIQMFSAKTNYVVLMISCAVGCVALAAGMVLGSIVSYYLLFVLAAWLVAMLVYHTVKMM
ncbi:MAG: hypothetical protein HFF09_03885 [Oscillospiraceae bacterium]|nr:hypothetical protein [Oscillospiraceae bacterium]